ncbi:MAG: MFS transporter [Deltaproteobacteria bacterium]|jgi:MFS family permease|nr:MFS transporter [Deltaproteobacteria bacterium]
MASPSSSDPSLTPSLTPSDSPVKEPSPKPPLWTLTYVTYLLVNLGIYLGYNMLLPTLSLYLASQGCDKKTIGLVISCFAVSSIAARFTTHYFCERYGPINVIKVGLALSAISCLLYIMIPEILSYAIARLIYGAGYGFTSTLMISLAASVIPKTRFAEGLGLLGLGSTTSKALGPLLGLTLLSVFGAKILFSSGAICYLLALLISLTLPKTSLSDKKEPLSIISLFKTIKNTYKTSILVFFYGMGISSVTLFLAIYCSEEGIPQVAHYYFVFSTIGLIFTRFVSGRLYDRHGPSLVIPPAAMLLLISFLIILDSANPTMYFVAAIIYGLGSGSLFPNLQVLTLAPIPRHQRTLSAAVFLNSCDLGVSVGSMFFGFLAHVYGSFAEAYLWGAINMAIILILYFVFFHLTNPANPQGD